MFTTLEAARRFTKIFAETSRDLNILIKAGKGHPAIPRNIVEEVYTRWGHESLQNLRVVPQVIGKPSKDPVLFIGNHMSYVDIPLLASNVPVMFVAKRELAKWPVFGSAIQKLGMVFVDRNAANSRADASEAVAKCIIDRKQPVAIFPSGTTTVNEEKPWRWGTFKLAKRFNLPIQPFRIKYEPARRVAYIDDDVFAFHLMGLLRTKEIHAKIEFGPVTHVGDPQEECLRWQSWCREWFTSEPKGSGNGDRPAQ